MPNLRNKNANWANRTPSTNFCQPMAERLTFDSSFFSNLDSKIANRISARNKMVYWKTHHFVMFFPLRPFFPACFSMIFLYFPMTL